MEKEPKIKSREELLNECMSLLDSIEYFGGLEDLEDIKAHEELVRKLREAVKILAQR